MAKLEWGDESGNHNSIEIRPWVRASTRREVGFYAGHGFTGATSIVWAEVMYNVNDLPLIYTRYPFQMYNTFTADLVDALLSGQESELVWSADLPALRLVFAAHTYEDDGEKHTSYEANIELDLSPIYGGFVGSSGVKFTMWGLTADSIRGFAEQFERELDAMDNGVRPDPASVPVGFRSMPFSRELNRRAYDALAAEDAEPPLVQPEADAPHADAIETSPLEQMYLRLGSTWGESLSNGAHVLDVGCGNGLPILPGLVAQGLQIVGIDLSALHLAQARVNVPSATFLQMAASEMTFEAEFDGAIAFHSLLHMDPIELRIALWRIYCALKPGGILFVMNTIENANSRYSPYDYFRKQRVWQWYYEPAEMLAALQERELFTIVAQDSLVTQQNEEPLTSESWPIAGGVFGFLVQPRQPIVYGIVARRNASMEIL